MGNPQYAILRFAKYKGPEISRIEAHDERTKETYASNPDVDTARSHLCCETIKSFCALSVHEGSCLLFEGTRKEI